MVETRVPPNVSVIQDTCGTALGWAVFSWSAIAAHGSFLCYRHREIVARPSPGAAVSQCLPYRAVTRLRDFLRPAALSEGNTAL